MPISCRNRHCPKCQGAAARTWLAEREADLLPVGYFHVVFTLPAEIADVAFHNKAVVYDLLFKAASETMLTIAGDPKHLGARIGITAVLHTWGSALTHHPHIHMIVPGGGISPDGERWISSRPAFLLPVRVLGALFRRLFLTRLMALHDAGQLGFFGSMAHLAERRAFLRHLSPIRKKRWVVYAKPPFAGPEAVLAYLSRYTHRVAISNSRLLGFDEGGVTFRYKDYRRGGTDRQQVMTLTADEFIRRFLLHVLPKGSTASGTTACSPARTRKANLERARQLLAVAPPPDDDTPSNRQTPVHHARAAAGTWSSSRSSNAATNRARRHPCDIIRETGVVTRHGSPQQTSLQPVPRGTARLCTEPDQERTVMPPNRPVRLWTPTAARKQTGPLSNPPAYRQRPSAAQNCPKSKSP